MRQIFISLVFLLVSLASLAQESSLALVGRVPGEYLGQTFDGQVPEANKTYLSILTVSDRLIVGIEAVRDMRQAQLILQKKSYPHLFLNQNGVFDVIYPGLIDLHGHNKQTMLPLWQNAQGRFANRYEWRKASDEYKQVQSWNMNPWVGNTTASLAAYRWSELQAMVLGTTYLQGYRLYDAGFAIQSVEDPGAFLSEQQGISTPGDIVDPEKWVFLWDTLKPIMQEMNCLYSYSCYQKAVSHYLKNSCATGVVDSATIELQVEKMQDSRQVLASVKVVPQFVVENPVDKLSEDWLLASSSQLSHLCQGGSPDQLVDFFTDHYGNKPHSEIIKRNAYLNSGRGGAIVTHLSEGRRHDPISRTEFELLKLAGLARKGFNFVHGVGLDKESLAHMAGNEMGLVWSPLSNFILYGETLDVSEALKQGVLLALGSDWTPTGSRGVLDELKVAADYLDRKGLLVSDQQLYNMVTKNPAKIINHFGSPAKGEHGIGTLQSGSMASLIVTRQQVSNPYTNLVRHTRAQDIHLMMVDGQLIYGSRKYMGKVHEREYLETLSGRVFDYSLKKNSEVFPYNIFHSSKAHVLQNVAELSADEARTHRADYWEVLQKKGFAGFDELEKQLKEAKKSSQDLVDNVVASAADNLKLNHSSRCGFYDEKVFFVQKTPDRSLFADIQQQVDLDTYSGIAKFLGMALLSQSFNAYYVEGQPMELDSGAVEKFPPLFGCDDEDYSRYLDALTPVDGQALVELMAVDRSSLREQAGLYTDYDDVERQVRYSVPHELAVLYGYEDRVVVPNDPSQFRRRIEVELLDGELTD